MRRFELAIGAAALALMAAPALAQSTEGPVAPPNSMNTTGPTTCTTPTDVTCPAVPKAASVPPSNAVPSEQTPNQVMAPATMPAPDTAAAAPTRQYSSTDGTAVQVVSNGPVPDTPENRKKYGGPRSRAGRHTTPAGN